MSAQYVPSIQSFKLRIVLHVQRADLKYYSLTILIVTVTLSAGPSGYVNMVVILPRDKTDGETATDKIIAIGSCLRRKHKTLYIKRLVPFYPTLPSRPILPV